MITTSPAGLHATVRAAAAEVDGPWTPEIVRTLIGLSAVHDVAVDRGKTYPWWKWVHLAPLYELDVMGFFDIDVDQWAYVLELSGPRERPDHPRRTWISPAVEFHGDSERAYAEAARLLNDGTSRINRAGDR